MPDGDNWIYDVDATPKVGATIPETPDTPDTPDVPDTPPDTPDTPDTPDLPEQPDTPDTPVSPGTPDNPVSPDSPDNPVSPENPDNPVSPSNPDKPVLPQTGQLNWPVPVLACSGVLLFAAGWVLNRQGKKETDFALLSFRHSVALCTEFAPPQGGAFFVPFPCRAQHDFECAPRCSAHNQRKIYFLNLQFLKICGFSRIAFSRVGFGHEPLRHLALLDASSPEGGAFWVELANGS